MTTLSDRKKKGLNHCEGPKEMDIYLINHYFSLVTDQKPVAFMYKTLEMTSQIKYKKNSQMENWNFQFFLFDIIYHCSS